MQYKVAFSQNIHIVEGARPSKLDCQKDRRKRLPDIAMSWTTYMKHLKLVLIKKICSEYVQNQQTNR